MPSLPTRRVTLIADGRNAIINVTDFDSRQHEPYVEPGLAVAASAASSAVRELIVPLDQIASILSATAPPAPTTVTVQLDGKTVAESVVAGILAASAARADARIDSGDAQTQTAPEPPPFVPVEPSEAEKALRVVPPAPPARKAEPAGIALLSGPDAIDRMEKAATLEALATLEAEEKTHAQKIGGRKGVLGAAAQRRGELQAAGVTK